VQIGVFELDEPVPHLRDPHLMVALRPWIDVGSVGTLVLQTLETHFIAQDLGRIRRPGEFYDFTRYRPTLTRRGGIRHVELPNSTLRYAQTPFDHDFVFLHALEPHIKGEDFIESILQVAQYLGVRQYCQIGAMYGSGPHTRPLTATVGASSSLIKERLGQAGMKASAYEGPTSIMALGTQLAKESGMEILNILVQLPPYARLEEDHRGQATLLSLLDCLYEFGIDLVNIREKGDRQYTELGNAVEADPNARTVVRQLEQVFDSEIDQEGPKPQKNPSLAPEIERFLQGLEEAQENP
jgi:hypothetical protein